MNRSIKTARLLVCVVAICGSIEALFSANLVVVRARASEAYLESQKAGEEKLEKYHLVKGRFYAGDRVGGWAETMPVDEIILGVSKHLSRKGFRLAGEDEGAEYAIVFHYGISSGSQSFVTMTGQTQYDVNSVGTPSLSPFKSVQELGRARRIDSFEKHKRIYEKIGDDEEYNLTELLGLDRLGYISRSSSDSLWVDNLMLDERYFSILVAYEIEDMDSDTKNEPLWSTHYSIKARGQIFEEAIKDMNLVASDYFGREHEKLIKVRMTKKVRNKLLEESE